MISLPVSARLLTPPPSHLPCPPTPSSKFQLGSCAIGVRTSEGVVLAVEKRISSPLLEASSVEKVFEIDSHIGFAVSGLVADARTLVEHGRVECQSHRFTYDEPLRVESLTQALCDLAMSFGEGSEEAEADKKAGERKKVKMSRPFGVSLLLAGVDKLGPQLYHMDPSGTYVAYAAHAIGAGSEGAITQLVDKYTPTLTLNQAKALVTRVLAVSAAERAALEWRTRRSLTPSLPRLLPSHRTRWRKNSRRLILN
jgi:20S proteasome subunit alpha 5